MWLVFNLCIFSFFWGVVLPVGGERNDVGVKSWQVLLCFALSEC